MKEQEKQRILILNQEGFKGEEIASIMGYSTDYIGKILRGMGIVRKRGRKSTIPKETIKEMCALHALGMSYQKIGIKFGFTRSRVRECIRWARRES